MQSAMWAFEEVEDSQVSWRAMRSGGREPEARSVREVELFSFSRDRMLRE